MIAMRSLIVGVAFAATLAAAGAADARTVGQVIDDTAITAQVKAKLTVDRLSNLTKIEVTTHDGVVTLAGVVEDLERGARVAQVASTVEGVKSVVNNLQVTGSATSTAPLPPAPVATVPPTATTPPTGTTPPPGTPVDATGVVASVDASASTITLQDGRVLRTTGDTLVWQAAPLKDLRPGTQVIVRGATPVAVQPVTAAPPEWRMGTVSRVDSAASQIVLTDGTVVRVGPSTVVHRRGTRVWLDQVAPGAEVVVRSQPRSGSAEGSALPGSTPSGPLLDAAEINVVWTPVAGAR